jgi:hypothetical protein
LGTLPGAFLAWLGDERPLLPVGITVGEPTADGLEFSFNVANPVLRGWVDGRAKFNVITVSEDWADETWGFVLDLDVSIEAVTDGFICSICASAGKERVFLSREALWHDHLSRRSRNQ